MTRTNAASTFESAFIGIVVPDEARYVNAAFSRAGNNCQLELLRSLGRAGVHWSAVLSFMPLPGYPRCRRLWVTQTHVELFKGCSAVLLSFLNIVPLKQLHLGMSIFVRLVCWGVMRRSQKKLVYMYNVSPPPGVFAYAAARLIKAKVVASLYDIGIPGQGIPCGLWQRCTFRMSQWIIPRLDGRIVITEDIARDFGARKHYLHVDGAVSQACLECEHDDQAGKTDKRFVIAFAGKLWSGNGIELILNAFSRLGGENFRLVLAGDGPLKECVLESVAKDKRIEYRGRLEHDAVLKLYSSADVLVNMRPTTTLTIPYAFPSKLLEYLASGTPVITTCVAHTEREYGGLCFVLRRETAEELANLIETVEEMDPVERRRVGSEAQSYMRKQKTWAVQGQRIARYLNRVVYGAAGTGG